jgi:hypothetical protein
VWPAEPRPASWTPVGRGARPRTSGETFVFRSSRLLPTKSDNSSAHLADQALDAFHHPRNFLCVDLIRRVGWAVIVGIAEQRLVRDLAPGNRRDVTCNGLDQQASSLVYGGSGP